MSELAVTDGVLRSLAEAKPANGGNGADRLCYRFVLDTDGNPQLQFDDPLSTDELYSLDGRTVLAIPPEFAAAYAGKTLDINDAGDFLIF